MIRLTNSSSLFAGEPIYINPDHITCVYYQAIVDGGSLKTLVHSRIGAGDPITWEVEESAENVIKLIEEANAKCEGCSCK